MKIDSISVTTLYACTLNVLTDTQFRCKGPRKILICSSESFQTWACPVIKILSKNDRLNTLLQLFVAVWCRNASYHPERCFCFPYLGRKEASLSSFYGLIEGLPHSPAATGKSHSHSEVPVSGGSRGCWVSWESHSITQLIRSQLRFHHDNVKPLNSADLVSVTAPLVFAEHFSLIAKSFILNFNKWVTHFSLMPQVLCHKFVFFLYSLTMLHTFPHDITRVTESNYFALSFCSLPRSLCLCHNVLSA